MAIVQSTLHCIRAFKYLKHLHVVRTKPLCLFPTSTCTPITTPITTSSSSFAYFSTQSHPILDSNPKSFLKDSSLSSSSSSSSSFKINPIPHQSTQILNSKSTHPILSETITNSTPNTFNNNNSNNNTPVSLSTPRHKSLSPDQYLVLASTFLGPHAIRSQFGGTQSLIYEGPNNDFIDNCRKAIKFYPIVPLIFFPVVMKRLVVPAIVVAGSALATAILPFLALYIFTKNYVYSIYIHQNPKKSISKSRSLPSNTSLNSNSQEISSSSSSSSSSSEPIYLTINTKSPIRGIIKSSRVNVNDLVFSPYWAMSTWKDVSTGSKYFVDSTQIKSEYVNSNDFNKETPSKEENTTNNNNIISTTPTTMSSFSSSSSSSYVSSNSVIEAVWDKAMEKSQGKWFSLFYSKEEEMSRLKDRKKEKLNMR